jgi:hypothetical protein
MSVSAGRRPDDKLGAKQMNFMAQVSKTACGTIEISFGPALVIQALMGERDFHDITVLAFGAPNQYQRAIPIGTGSFAPQQGYKRSSDMRGNFLRLLFTDDDIVARPLKLVHQRSGVLGQQLKALAAIEND